MFAKIIHHGVILPSAKSVLASCNRGHHINHFGLPQQRRKVFMAATPDYHGNHPWLPWQHIMIRFLYHFEYLKLNVDFRVITTLYSWHEG
jgi:hypothetical protein